MSIYTYLKEVRYQVRAHFVWNENRPELLADRDEHKHHNIARRMIERGGRLGMSLGTRECHGEVEPCVFGEGAGAYDNVAEMILAICSTGSPTQTKLSGMPRRGIWACVSIT